MVNRGVRAARGRVARGSAGWPRTEWKSLVAACAISLLAHLLVLGVMRPEREGDGRAPVLQVTLTGALIARKPEPVATAVPEPTPEPVPPPHQQEPAPARTPAPVPQRSAAVQPRPQAPAPAAPSHEERPPALAQEPEQPASPVSSPELGEVSRRVQGRRLAATVWIDAQGRVDKAFVKRNELSEEVAVLLEQALGTMRFAPAQLGGRPVESVLDTRLCFDDAGVLGGGQDAECLRPPSPTTTAEPASR